MTEAEIQELVTKVQERPECQCGSTLDTRDDPSVYPFCTFCGSRNPYFYPRGVPIPTRHWSPEMQQEYEDCKKGHPKITSEIAKMSEAEQADFVEQPFCELCGSRIIPDC